MTTISVDWTGNDAPLRVVDTLRQAGHEAWLAGGCVRDLLLGRHPKDFDVASSATPEEVRRCFAVTVPVQPELGVTLVVLGKERIEVTRFRTEGPYLDGRHPTHVGPTDARGDVQRRDFTINGLLMDPATGEVADHVGGVADLRAGILRAIGDADLRFSEDYLRILRAVRFSVRLDLRIEASTWEAMGRHAHKVSALSGERIHEELAKMFHHGPFSRCLDLLNRSSVLGAISPELAEALSHPQAMERAQRWMGGALAHPEAWVALLAVPLCPWWNPDSPLEQGSRAQESLMESLRCSKAQIETARAFWKWWPVLQSLPQRPSDWAPLVRDRHFEAIRSLLELASEADPLASLPTLDALRRSTPPAPPALGEAFQRAGVPKGPLLGRAIREADRRILDEGRSPDLGLVKEVTEFILENP